MTVAEASRTVSEQNDEDIRKYRETRDEYIREDFFRRNDRLCTYIARKFDNTKVDFDERMSHTRYGLLKAFNTFKLDAGIKFATYATRCMENEILMSLRKAERRKSEVSIFETVARDDKGNDLTIEDFVGREDQNIDHFHKKQEAEEAMKVIDTELNERERLIFFRLLEGMTQKEVAESLGMSQSYISRLEKRIKLKIRKSLLRKEGNLAVVKTTKKETKKPMKSKELATNTGTISEKKERSMKRKKAFLWLLQNTELNDTQMAEEIGVTLATVKMYKKELNKGKLDGITPESPVLLGLKPAADVDEMIKGYAETCNTFVPLPEAPKEEAKVDTTEEAVPKRMDEDFRRKWSEGKKEVVVGVFPSAERKNVALQLELDNVEAFTIEGLLRATKLSSGKKYRVKLVIEEKE